MGWGNSCCGPTGNLDAYLDRIGVGDICILNGWIGSEQVRAG